tara:strand:- start:8 stop:238 length:231 start_codon:yes stop_codon:yes gene_type:complete
MHAYIDPGSGSAIITAILGFFAAVAYSFRKFFYNLRSKFKPKQEEEENIEEESMQTADSIDQKDSKEEKDTDSLKN